MRVQLEAEEEKTKSSNNRCLWVVYCCLILFCLIMALARFGSLCSRVSYRKSITTFPSQCGDWAINAGCSYITMNDCLEYTTVQKKRNNTFSTPFPITINGPIANCAGSVKGASLQSPADLEKQTTFQDLIHVTFSSTLLGFIDDMYMQTYWNATAAVTVVNIMSQNRLGSNDLGVNQDHVNRMLRCLNIQLSSIQGNYTMCNNW